MCQVNPSKASKENTTILCFCMLKQRIISSRHTKQSQLFGTRQSIEIITKHKVKTTPSMSCNSLSHSQCKPLLHLQARTSYSFPTPSNLFANNTVRMGVQTTLLKQTKQPKKTKRKL